MTVVCTSLMMAGMAMLTMVTSSRAMNMPSETAERMSHLRGWPSSGSAERATLAGTAMLFARGPFSVALIVRPTPLGRWGKREAVA